MTRRIRVRHLLVLVGLLIVQASAWAQTTGKLSGHVADSQGLAVPGATVSVTSPSLQGIRVAATSSRGDFLIPGLPPGPYTVNITLSGFEPVVRHVAVAPGQTVPLDAVLGVGLLQDRVEVVGRTADVAARTALMATTFQQALLSVLPGNRDPFASLSLLAPGVLATGPGGAVTFGGAMSFDNLFLVNGFDGRENLRGQWLNLFIEDAVQETTVVTGGVSAEFGRFSGGMVNLVTKSGGNDFSGSLRETLNNDNWRALTPFEQTQMAAGSSDIRVHNVVPTYEYTFGGPILRDRLWFFHAGRIQTQQSGRTLAISNIPYVSTDETRRYETKGTYTVARDHRVQGTFTKIVRNQFNNPSSALAMDTRSLTNQQRPEELAGADYSGVLSKTFLLEGRYSRRDSTAAGVGATTTDRIDGTVLVDQTRGNSRY